MQNQHESEVDGFDERAWRDSCEKLAREAVKGCGLSHDYYVELFSLSVDRALEQLPDTDRPLAVSIASDWDYATTDERKENQEWLSENGYCTHGITLGCCPAGCGS